MIYNVITIIFLIINSITDLKYKKISMVICIIFGLAGVIINFIFKEYSLISLILAITIGVIIIIISKATKEEIGMGDGFVVIVLGLYIGLYNNLSVILYGLVISSIISIILLSIKKLGRKDRIPFVPCLLAGYIITLTLEG